MGLRPQRLYPSAPMPMQARWRRESGRKQQEPSEVVGPGALAAFFSLPGGGATAALARVAHLLAKDFHDRTKESGTMRATGGRGTPRARRGS